MQQNGHFPKEAVTGSKGQENLLHLEKKWSQNSASEEPFWKTAPLWQRGAIFFFIIMFYEMAPRHKEEPKWCHKGVCSADKKMDSLRSRFGSSFFSECTVKDHCLHIHGMKQPDVDVSPPASMMSCAWISVLMVPEEPWLAIDRWKAID